MQLYIRNLIALFMVLIAAIAMHRQERRTGFDRAEPIVQVVAQLFRIAAKVLLHGFIVGVQQLLRRQHGMGFARAICAFHPDGELMLAVNRIDQTFQKLDKALVRVEFLPQVGMLRNDGRIDDREVFRIDIEIITIQLRHRFIPLQLLCKSFLQSSGLGRKATGFTDFRR